MFLMALYTVNLEILSFPDFILDWTLYAQIVITVWMKQINIFLLTNYVFLYQGFYIWGWTKCIVVE